MDIVDVAEAGVRAVLAIWSCAPTFISPNALWPEIGDISVQVVHPHVIVSAGVELYCSIGADMIIVVGNKPLHRHGLSTKRK